MRLLLLLLGLGVVSLAQDNAFGSIQLWGRDTSTTDSPPSCATNCLVTIIPKYCGSLTNTTCICTDTTMASAMSTCALEACSIPDVLLLEEFSKDTCGVKNDKGRSDLEKRLCYVLPALTVLFFTVRIIARLRTSGVGPDDWMMVAAVSAYLVDTATGIEINLSGSGIHTYYLAPSEISEALKWFYISELFYLVAITLTKLSLLLFFRRIFPNKKLKIGTWIVGGFILASNFAMLMTLTFQCIPFYGNWENWKYKVPPVKCIDSFAAIYTAAAFSIFHDLIILVMPMPILRTLNLSWQKKASLVVMFSVGTFVIVCSLVRLPTLMQMGRTSDPSYDEAPVVVWTHLEISVGIICGCLPAWRSLLVEVIPSLRTTVIPTNTAMPTTSKASSGILSKISRKHSRVNSSTRSFIELNDHVSMDRQASGVSSVEGSDGVHNTKNLAPYRGTVHTMIVPVDGRNGGGEREREVSGSGITMTRTVDVQMHSDHGRFVASERRDMV